MFLLSFSMSERLVWCEPVVGVAGGRRRLDCGGNQLRLASVLELATHLLLHTLCHYAIASTLV